MQTTLWYFIIILIFTYLIYDTYKDGGLRETVKFIVIFITLFTLLRTFFMQPFLVEGPSMSPAFETNNYLLVDKLSGYFTNLQRYDVVIFDIPDPENKYHKCVLPMPYNDICLWSSNRYLIKRVIGLPNEKVLVNNGDVTVYNEEYKEGLAVEKKFILYPSPISDQINLGPDEYYVMGDNRANSSDSRYFGAVKLDKIVGVPLLRLFPFRQIDLFPGSLDNLSK